MTTYRLCMYMYACMHVYYTCVHVCMYVCMFVICVCIYVNSIILQTSVIKLFPWQHIRIHSGHFVHMVLSLLLLLIMEPWVINPRKVHAIKSKILRVALVIMMYCDHFLLLCSKLLRCENKQFLKRIISLNIQTSEKMCIKDKKPLHGENNEQA